MRTALALAVFFLAFGIAGCMDKQDAERAEKVTEDMLFWDCTSSGNFKCGEPITNYPVPGALTP